MTPHGTARRAFLAGAAGVVAGGIMLPRAAQAATVWAPGSGSSGSAGVLTASEYGIVDSATLDQATIFNAFLNDPTGKTKLLDVGAIKYTVTPTSPVVGHVKGVGTGGDFLTTLIPYNCAAFNFTGSHESTFENFLIWPQGTAAPVNFITISDSYALKFINLRMHLASTYVCSGAIVKQTKVTAYGGLYIVWDKCIFRHDGAYYPIGFEFGPDSGSAHFQACDFETCDVGFKHQGGRVTLDNPYMERMGTNAFSLEASTDTESSFCINGGVVGWDNSALGFALRDGAKNISVNGTFLVRNASGYDAYIYGGVGSSNIKLDFANPLMSHLGCQYSPASPTVYQFGKGINALPASKVTSINVTTGTLSAGDITGAGSFVSLMSTNATPGTQTTRTAAQMIGDHGMGTVDASYHLRITNTGAGTFTLGAGTNVTLTGTMTVAQNTWRDFIVTFNASVAGAVTIQSIGVGTYS